VVLPETGADGALSGLELKRPTADGYTFLFGSNSALAVVPNLRKDPPYDPTADFTPITYLGDNTFFIYLAAVNLNFLFGDYSVVGIAAAIEVDNSAALDVSWHSPIPGYAWSP
jgi:hypothetical protein